MVQQGGAKALIPLALEGIHLWILEFQFLRICRNVTVVMICLFLSLISGRSIGTLKGKNQASQALARIGITINPEVAFPGQRMCEVVRPLLGLLHQECKALENFEALMALCNLAGFEAARKR